MKIQREAFANSQPTQDQPVKGASLWLRGRWFPLVTLLALALGAFGLVASLPGAAASTPSGIAPQPPTAIATPTPLPPTPTPTFRETGDVLDTLYLDIAPADFARIEATRERALQLGVLLAEGNDYVPAQLRLGQEEIPVRVRLKGDWIEHIMFDKWSLRIQTKGEQYVYGMKVFAIQDPARRNYLNEWLFLKNLSQEGVLGVRYRFARVVLNGTYKGIYAVEEGFSKELMESQLRRAGLLLRYDEDLMWKFRAYHADQNIPVGVNDFYVIDDYGAGDNPVNAPGLAQQSDVAIGKLRAIWTGERAAGEVLDLETMGRFLALSDLWSAPHGLIWHNLRYYYNPITTLLEPVAINSNALVGDLSLLGLPQSAFPGNPDLQRTVFYNDPRIQAAYVKELWRMSQPGYVEALEQELGPEYEALRAALTPEFGEEALARPWDILRQRQALAREVLNPFQATYAYLLRPQPATTTLAIDVGNILAYPVEIVGLVAGDTFVPVNRNWVQSDALSLTVEPAPSEVPDALVLRGLPGTATEIPYVQLQVPRDLLPSANAIPELTLITRLWGLTQTLTQPVLGDYPPPLEAGPVPPAPTLATALARYPYLAAVSDSSWLRIPAGTWTITDPLILPAGYGLIVDPGTTLLFEHGSFLLARGPLDFRGSDKAPIVLRPTTDLWYGVVVLDAGSPSIWRHVTIERTSAMNLNGWSLTGGITFYRSAIRLESCHILDSLSEDGINVIRERFEFVGSEWARTISDAFDADFGNGMVESCYFHDLGGDGLDVSGTLVAVRNLHAVNLGDKGISAGEESTITAENVYVENGDFGVVAKDNSHITLNGATIVAPRIAALAAYTKKPVYGRTATITATAVTFPSVPPERLTLVQTGCWIDLDGARIWGTDIDVDALYMKWVKSR